jgi:hypothetical protein
MFYACFASKRLNPQLLKPTATRPLRTVGFVWGDAVGLRRGRLLSKLQTGTRRCLAKVDQTG